MHMRVTQGFVCTMNIYFVLLGSGHECPFVEGRTASAFDYCKCGAEVIVINLLFQYFSLAYWGLLQNGVHNTKEEVSLNKKRRYGNMLLLFL